MKKKIGVFILTLTLMFGLCSNTVFAAYSDVYQNGWYYGAVQYVSQNGIMTGLNDTYFGVGESLKRGQFALILYRLAGTPDVEFENKFPDIGANDWYANAVIWASDNGIVTGYTDTGLFGPSDEITREQMVTMLHRFEGSPQVSADLSGYPDSGLVGAWSLAGMQWAVANGIISGDNNMLNPQGITTREVCATIIMRFQGGEYIETEAGPGGFVNPCPGANYVSSEFGYRVSPTEGASSNHQGRDYAASEGTAILATASGKVVLVGYTSARGNYIVIDHGNGVECYYQHCSKIIASAGDIVEAGEKIAEVGSTGIVSGPHLHFEVHENGVPVDPRKYVPE